MAYAEVEAAPNYSVDDEGHLTLAGFLAFADPPLPDAAEALAALRRDGVEVKIITGDGDLVTLMFAARLASNRARSCWAMRLSG